MNRRTLLHRGATAGALALAGCSALGGGGEATPTARALDITDFGYHAADDGSLVVTVTVANTAGDPVTGTLYVDLTVDSTAYTRVRTVELKAAGTTEITARFDVSVEEFENGNSTLSFRWGYQAA